MSLLDKVAFNWKHLSQQNHPVRSILAYVFSKARLSSLIRYRRNGSIFQLRSAGLARILWADPDFVLDGELFLSTVFRPGDTVIRRWCQYRGSEPPCVKARGSLWSCSCY